MEFPDYVIQNGNVVSLAGDVTESYKFSGSKPFEINKFVILFAIFGLLLQALHWLMMLGVLILKLGLPFKFF